MDFDGKSDTLKAFFSHGRLLKFPKNQLVLRAGDEPAGVYLIETGIIKIFTLSKEGNEHVTHFFGPGDIFPIIWLFRGSTRHSYYESLEPVSLRLVSQADFFNFITKTHQATLAMLVEMVERYSRYSGRIENLLYSDARERAAYRLLSLGNRFGINTPKGLAINAVITHEDMAHSLNMTRETFGRTLSRLSRAGIISYDDQHRIVIKDIRALIKIIGFDEAEAQWPELLKSYRIKKGQDHV